MKGNIKSEAQAPDKDLFDFFEILPRFWLMGTWMRLQ
jgi:hypothetical protein